MHATRTAVKCCHIWVDACGCAADVCVEGRTIRPSHQFSGERPWNRSSLAVLTWLRGFEVLGIYANFYVLAHI